MRYIMSRTLVNNNSQDFKLNVHSWFILRNGWEYYVTELPDEDGIGEALVLGFEDEIGSFSMDEIKPYIVASAKDEDLFEVAPANGWRWLD